MIKYKQLNNSILSEIQSTIVWYLQLHKTEYSVLTGYICVGLKLVASYTEYITDDCNEIASVLCLSQYESIRSLCSPNSD